MSIDPSIIKRHAEQSTLAYVKVRDTYASFAEVIKIILEAALRDYAIHTIQARAKSFDSFTGKASKLNPATNDVRYLNPLSEITDLAGIRVITYVPQTVKDVEEVIRREFAVQERLDKDAALLGTGRIGYKSIHFLVRLKEPRTQSTEYARFNDKTAEIQVRTILQHAWAEMEHDIQYKSDQQIPNELKRRFVALAGLLEIADREFESIQKEDDRLRAELTLELAEELSQLGSGEESKSTLAGEADNAPSLAISSETRSPNSDIESALERYDNLIVAEPGQYAHFLGRAKAKFLLGDRSGALDDLGRAENLAPGNEHVLTVRQRIEDGRVNGKSSLASAAAQYANKGNRRLAQGIISDAVTNFAKAEQLGLSKIHSSFNFAMCACLAKDLAEINRQLDRVTPHSGSFVEINHLTLRLIASELLDCDLEDRPALASRLKQLISSIGSYELENSPLRFLVAGINASLDVEAKTRLAYILDILHHARPPG